MFDLQYWLQNNHIPISDTRQDTTKTEYILSACPWNSAHGASITISQSKGGMITANCSHPECNGKGWTDLKKLYQKEPDYICPADMLVDYIEENVTLFKTQTNDPYILVPDGGGNKPIKVASPEFLQWIRLKYRGLTAKTLSKEHINRVQETIAALALNGTDIRQTAVRVIKDGNEIFYDLMGDNATIVKTSPSNVEIVNSKDYPIIFERTGEMLPQIAPDLSTSPKELLPLLAKLFRVPDNQMILFAVYIVSAFEPSITHPMLIMQGEKGSAKSTALSLLSKLVSPTVNELSPLPSLQDLPSALSNGYFCCFDNLRKISQEVSDMLCVCVTGGSIRKRKLYSDNEVFCQNIKRMIALTGIEIAGAQTDLLDRSVIFNLNRISPDERLTQAEIIEEYQKLAPEILGSCFNTLANALALLPTVSLQRLPRMADFAKLGWCIAEAIGVGLGNIFFTQYEENQSITAAESVASSVFIDTVADFMNDKPSWTGSVSALYIAIKAHAQFLGINTMIAEFPQAPNYISRRLNEYKSNLIEIGIDFIIKNIGNHKSITIINKNK